MSWYKKERDKEFYRAFRQALNIPHITYEEAIRRAINTPTYRYWISADTLYRECLMRERGSKWRSNRAQSRHKLIYDELFQRIQEMKRTTFKGYSTYTLSTIVINQPAPRFFIGFRVAERIIRNFTHKHGK